MPYGQLVVGAPGSGKSTYCQGMLEFLDQLGRSTIVVNLDPANEDTLYECAVDVRDLVNVTDVMTTLELGPNAALVYSMEFLEANLEWLQEALVPYHDKYILFDCPGQVELFSHHGSLRNIITQLMKGGKYQLTAVHLVDIQQCRDGARFIAASLLSLATMVRLEMPQVNVISKVDLVEKIGGLPFDLEFYTDMTNMSEVLGTLPGAVPSTDDPEFEGAVEDGGEGEGEVARCGGSGEEGEDVGCYPEDPSAATQSRSARFLARFQRLNHALCELVQDYALVSFTPLAVTDKESMAKLLEVVDRSNGFISHTRHRHHHP